MRYKVSAVHKETGESRVLTVDAADEATALRVANRQGFAVERIERVADAPAPPVTEKTPKKPKDDPPQLAVTYTVFVGLGWLLIALTLFAATTGGGEMAAISAAMVFFALALGWGILSCLRGIWHEMRKINANLEGRKIDRTDPGTEKKGESGE